MNIEHKIEKPFPLTLDMLRESDRRMAQPFVSQGAEVYRIRENSAYYTHPVLDVRYNDVGRRAGLSSFYLNTENYSVECLVLGKLGPRCE